MRARYLKAKEVCAMLSIGTSTLSTWSKDPTRPFPKPINIGTGRQGLRWKESEVLKFIAGREYKRDREQAALHRLLRKAG